MPKAEYFKTGPAVAQAFFALSGHSPETVNGLIRVADAEKSLAVSRKQCLHNGKLHWRKILHFINKHMQRAHAFRQLPGLVKPPVQQIGIVHILLNGVFTGGITLCRLRHGAFRRKLRQGSGFPRKGKFVP